MCFYSEFFFLLLETTTEISCKPFLFNFFSSQQYKEFFRVMETYFESNAIHSDEWKRIFFLVFFYSGHIFASKSHYSN